jgi:cysteine desulfurase family protein (TIGR01976 family)
MFSLAEPFERLLPWIRAQFPQVENLRDGRRRVYLDNAAGTLVPQVVADAMAGAAIWANPQPGRHWPPSPETTRDHERTRALLADFLNAGGSDSIFLSESTTASLYKLREALEPRWGTGDNVVVTDCDHFANISPWEWRADWEPRRARMLPGGHLDTEHLASLLDRRTRVVAVTMASNGLGTVIRLPEAVRIVRERAPEAVVVVDAVHGAPHLPIDVQALGADALAFSSYKLFGPPCGVLWMRESLAVRLEPYRVEPHTDPGTRMEWGTLDNATAAGIRAALEYLQRLGERLEPRMVGQLAAYPRGRRLFKIALAGIQAYETSISQRVLAEVAGIERVILYGITDPARPEQRVPTFAFSIAGVTDADLERRCWEVGRVQVAGGNHYAASVLRGLCRSAVGRASFAHYNDTADIGAFLQALRDVASVKT